MTKKKHIMLAAILYNYNIKLRMLTHQIPQQPPSKAKTTSNAVKLRKIT